MRSSVARDAAVRGVVMAEDAVLFTRDLPGGGFVAIESLPVEDGVHRARVSVERRTDPERRLGHDAPIIVTLEGESQSELFEELYRIAVDNVEIARGIMRWQAERRRGKGETGSSGSR
jgi:hypothetical protein